MGCSPSKNKKGKSSKNKSKEPFVPFIKTDKAPSIPLTAKVLSASTQNSSEYKTNSKSGSIAGLIIILF